MKKITAILLILALLALTGCSSAAPKAPDLSANITVETDNPNPAPEADTGSDEGVPSTDEGTPPTAEEAFSLLRGVYTCDMQDGGIYFINVYEQDGAVVFEDGYLDSGYFFRGTVSDVIFSNFEGNLVSVNVDYPEISPSEMDPEGTEAYAMSYTIDLASVEVGSVGLLTESGSMLNFSYSGPDFDHLS